MFRQRESAFENSYAWNAHKEFITKANRNKMLGLWTANKLGLDSEEAQELSNNLVEAGIYAKDDETMVGIIFAELSQSEYLDCESQELYDKPFIRGQLNKFTILAEKYVSDHALEIFIPKSNIDDVVTEEIMHIPEMANSSSIDYVTA